MKSIKLLNKLNTLNQKDRIEWVEKHFDSAAKFGGNLHANGDTVYQKIVDVYYLKYMLILTKIINISERNIILKTELYDYVPSAMDLESDYNGVARDIVCYSPFRILSRNKQGLLMGMSRISPILDDVLLTMTEFRYLRSN